MNELEEMKRLADEIVAEGEAFCRRMGQAHREMMRMIDTAAGNYRRMNEQLKALRYG